MDPKQEGATEAPNNGRHNKSYKKRTSINVLLTGCYDNIFCWHILSPDQRSIERFLSLIAKKTITAYWENVISPTTMVTMKQIKTGLHDIES